MPRGGARPGAGRKSALSHDDQFWIGLECERRWQRKIGERQERAIAAKTEEVRKYWNVLRSLPRNERQRFLGSFEGETYREDVVFALREDQRICAEDDREPGRLLNAPIRRPKGGARQIIRDMSANESTKRGRAISEDMIERCWAAYRRFTEELES